jgi:predicted DCC family thiol-disulfide oxidoreductase YuxK
MRDRAERFQFASLQSEAARRLLQNAVGVPERLPDSVILIEQGQVYTRSTAALRIARRLCGPWPLAYLFILVPAIIRDTVYDLIARNRFRLFGRQSACLVPTPALRDRFL